MEYKIKIYLCDDNDDFAAVIQRLLSLFFEQQHRFYEISTFADGIQLLTQFRADAADVVLLDIDMPSMTGFEAARQLQALKRDVHIIFITGYDDAVFQSYEYHPFWFVRKSHLEDLSLALSKLLAFMDAERQKTQPLLARLSAGQEVVELDVRTVKYITAHNHYILITYSDRHETKLRYKLSDAEKQLFPFHFIRVQNSVIVNCRFIAKVNSRVVTLHDGETITISRKKVDEVRHEFQKFLRSI